MRLGLDLLFLIPDETGGRETYARELISAMFAVEPHLTATAFVNRDATGPMMADLRASMRLVRVPISARRPEQWAVGELGLLPVAGRRAGIDLLHSLANFAPVWSSFRRVITLHDLQYRAVPQLLTPMRRVGTAAMLETALRRADRIITVSEFTRHEAERELGINGERIDVVPNGVGSRPTAAKTGERRLRERHDVGTRPVVLAVASDLPHKNLDSLIDALALIQTAQRPVLVLVGAGTDGARLTRRTVESGLSDDVRLLGYQAAGDLEGWYGLARCVALPTLYEGFGLPVLEAMTRGVPVVCSDIPALREVAGDSALRFQPGNAGDIARAIERLIGDDELVRRLTAGGVRQATRFSWERAAEATLAAYRRALDPGGAGIGR